MVAAWPVGNYRPVRSYYMKVFLVSTGEYSDYRVLGICSTRENAERFKRLFNARNSIEDYELDNIPDAPQGLEPFEVWMYEDGECRVKAASVCQVGEFPDGKANANDNESMLFWVFAENDLHAAKIANEKRVQLIAMNKWRNP